ncbi:hypothetical protein [Duganella violaceipulchra]|uniref:Uncharacterized protein n=1 Tax=Duganella violaceipulchra TaxID=2849652 RepID=A0AA41LAK7_9BURK|nr:hypothetical protein [Duganella violaceicalia]MBV6324370.1 hypothetical protein [Duganella violaceicalia]MCP2007236.1 hypothetical protein [Duganella violaceicalia]
MASKTLGRVSCPISCGHTAAQVKIKTDKGEKTAYPYVHCAACGVQLHTRSEDQARALLAITRPEKGAQDAPAAPPAPERPADVPAAPQAPEAPPAPAKRAAGLFDGLFGATA